MSDINESPLMDPQDPNDTVFMDDLAENPPEFDAPLVVQPPARELPRNVEAEQALLGSLLANNNTLEKVSDFLRAEHFFEPAHGRIYEAIYTLVTNGHVADAVTLSHHFNRDEGLTQVGGSDYLVELQGSLLTIINAGDYGRIVYDLASRRKLIELGEDLVNTTYEAGINDKASEIIEQAEAQLFRLAEEGGLEKGFQSFKTALNSAIAMAEAAHKREGDFSGLPTGLSDLDRLLGGMHHSDLIILAGRPAMGKTALAANIGMNAARDHGAQVGFFSLEMSADQLAMRLLSEQAEVSSEKIRRGELTNEDFERVFQASRQLEHLNFSFDDTPAITVGAMRTRARRLKRQQGLDLIIVDYLQLMRGSAGGSESRVNEISEITRGLKAIAKELDVPVIALSQLSRQVESRDDKKPQLSDLRESGSIEQDADVVMFVFREEYYLSKAEPLRKPEESQEKFDERYAAWQMRMEEVHGQAKVIVAKQRHGPTGDVDLAFEGQFTRFSDLIRDAYVPEQRG